MSEPKLYSQIIAKVIANYRQIISYTFLLTQSNNLTRNWKEKCIPKLTIKL